MKDNNAIIQERVYRDIESVTPAYEERMMRRNECYDFYFGRQRTEEEVQKLFQQGRKNIIFNEIQPKVNHLIGSQTQLRMDTVVKGREKTDDKAARILTDVVRWAEDLSDIDQLETKVFTELAVSGYAAGVVRWTRDTEGYGYPVVEKIPMNELRWDGMAKKDDYSDAKWQARVIEIQREKAREIFPEYEDAVNKAGASTQIGGNTQYTFSNIKSVTQELTQDLTGATFSDDDREVITIIEHYEAIYKNQYIVLNGVNGTTYKFESKKEAIDFRDGLIHEYSEAGEILIDGNGDPLIDVDTHRKKRIIQTIIIGDEVVSSEEIALPDFPYVICTGYFDEGYSMGFVENLIAPQIFYNDTLSMLDYIIGTSSKGALTVVEQMLDKDVTIEDLQQELSQARPLIKVRNHAAIQPLVTPNPIPELYNNMSMATNYMITAVGGMNALGLQQNASESGRAIEMRAQAGGTGRLPLFDSLKKWRKNVALRLVWWIKNYMTPEQVLRVIGLSGDTPYINLKDSFLNTMAELNTDIVIDEAAKSSTTRQWQFTQLAQLAAQVQIAPEVIMPVLLKHSDISENDKQTILAQNQIYQQYLQQQAQMQQQNKMQQEAQVELEKRVIKDNLKQNAQYQTRQDAEEIYSKKLKQQAEMLKQQMAEMPTEQLSQII